MRIIKLLTAVAVVAAAGPAAAQYAADMAMRIAQDKVDAAHAVLRPGKYSCYAGGRYIFADLFITGPHSYRVEPGGSGAYTYAAGALTFSSGPTRAPIRGWSTVIRSACRRPGDASSARSAGSRSR